MLPPLVLMYHRVAAVRIDPWQLAVTPDHFDEHLEVLKSAAVVLPLRTMVEQWLRGALPDRCAAVTFDDGYADVAHAAIPLLERHRVPATIFVCSALIGDGRPFWWDELSQIILETDYLPGSVELAGAALRTENRAELLRAAHGALQPLSVEARTGQLDRLVRSAAVSNPSTRDGSAGRPITFEELRQLAANPFVDIGCHSATHPVLPWLSGPEQFAEIAGSKHDVERWIGRPVTLFAYPYGVHDHRTRGIVGDCGFVAACTAVPESPDGTTDVLQLPRLKVENWSGDQFARVWDPLESTCRHASLSIL